MKRSVPLPHHYAVIRMDPVRMVTDLGLDDPDTLREAQNMKTRKYLVYLSFVSLAYRSHRFSIKVVYFRLQNFRCQGVVGVAITSNLSPLHCPQHRRLMILLPIWWYPSLRILNTNTLQDIKHFEQPQSSPSQTVTTGYILR